MRPIKTLQNYSKFSLGDIFVPRRLSVKSDLTSLHLTSSFAQSKKFLKVQSCTLVKWWEASALSQWVSQPHRWRWILSIVLVLPRWMWRLVFLVWRKSSMLPRQLRRLVWWSFYKRISSRTRKRPIRLVVESNTLIFLTWLAIGASTMTLIHGIPLSRRMSSFSSSIVKTTMSCLRTTMKRALASGCLDSRSVMIGLWRASHRMNSCSSTTLSKE